MSTIKDTLEILKDYYNSTRQVGHTTAVMEGIKNVDGAILTHNQEFGTFLSKNGGVGGSSGLQRNPVLRKRKKESKIEVVSLAHIQNDGSVLKGLRTPLVIDNAALCFIFSDAYSEISRLESRLKMAEGKLEEISRVINR